MFICFVRYCTQRQWHLLITAAVVVRCPTGLYRTRLDGWMDRWKDGRMAGVVWKGILILPSFTFPVCFLFVSLHKIIHNHIYRVIQHHHMTSVLLSFCVIVWKKDDTNSFILHILFLIFALLCFCWLLCIWRIWLGCFGLVDCPSGKGRGWPPGSFFHPCGFLPYALRRLLTIPNNARDEARSLSLSPSTCSLFPGSLPASPFGPASSRLQHSACMSAPRTTHWAALQEYLPHASGGCGALLHGIKRAGQPDTQAASPNSWPGYLPSYGAGSWHAKPNRGRFPARQAGRRAYGQTDPHTQARTHRQHPARCPLTIPRHAPRCDLFTNSGPESHQTN